MNDNTSENRGSDDGSSDGELKVGVHFRQEDIGRDSGFVWDTSGDISVQRYFESEFGFEYPEGRFNVIPFDDHKRTSSATYNRLDRIPIEDISPERRPRLQEPEVERVEAAPPSRPCSQASVRTREHSYSQSSEEALPRFEFAFEEEEQPPQPPVQGQEVQPLQPDRMSELERGAALNRKIRAAKRKVDHFSEDKIEEIDIPTYRETLKDIFDKVNEVVMDIEEFIDNIQDQASKEAWEQQIATLMSHMENNERAVKRKVAEMITAQRQARQPAVGRPDVPQPVDGQQEVDPVGQQAALAAAEAAAAEVAARNQAAAQAQAERDARNARELARFNQKREIVLANLTEAMNKLNLVTNIESLDDRVGN